MSTKRNAQSNTGKSNPRIKSHYVSKDTEKMTVEFNGKLVEIRRVWDSKKKSLKQELTELTETPDVFKRNLLVVDACLRAVGIQWSDAPIKEVGKVTWREGSDEYESPRIRIKFLKNGGQVRLCRADDGTQKVELDVVTNTTVSQCIKDCQAWSDEDQTALEAARTAALRKRKEDRERHERYEQNYVNTFSCDEVFTRAGL